MVMIKKFNEFINEGMMSKMWRELDGAERRKEEEEEHIDVNIAHVDGNHSFTDANGVFHKKGYKITNHASYTLKELVTALIDARGNTCSLNDVDVSNISILTGLFRYDDSFDGDISGWDVSNVILFDELFLESCFTGENGNLNNWKICSNREKGVGMNSIKGVGMNSMFSKSNFKGDIPDWDVSCVSSFYNMFKDCKTFNGDLSKWDVSNSTSFSGMFCGSGFTGENGDIGNWKFNNDNERKIFDFRRMFANTKLNIDLDLSKWEVNVGPKDIYCGSMFEDCQIKEEYKPKFAR